MNENKMQGRSSQAFARNLRRLRSAVPNLTQRRLAKALGYPAAAMPAMRRAHGSRRHGWRSRLQITSM